MSDAPPVLPILDLARSLADRALQHQHGEARRTQVLHYAAFITAGRFDTDAHDADFDQVGRQRSPTRQSVGELPPFGSAMNRDVEFKFGCIDSSRRCVS